MEGVGWKDALFLREPSGEEQQRGDEADNDGLAEYERALDEAIGVLEDTVIKHKANCLEAASWLVSTLAGVGEALPPERRRRLLVPYLPGPAGGPQSDAYAPFVHELVSLFVAQQPDATERLLAASPSALRAFFGGGGPAQAQRAAAFFAHFSPEGDLQFRHGAAALARFALAHRDRAWRLLRWGGAHSQAPAVVAAKPHYFCELDVPATVRELAADGACPEFWASEDLAAAVRGAGGALVAAGAEAWAAELAGWAGQPGANAARLRQELESFVGVAPWRPLATRLAPLLPEGDRVGLLRRIFESPEFQRDRISLGPRLAFEESVWSGFGEALLAAALGAAAPQLLRMLRGDEALAQRWDATTKEALNLAAGGRHWALRRRMVAPGGGARKRLRTVLLLHSFFSFAALQESARAGADRVREFLEHGGISVGRVEEGSDGSGDDEQRRKRKERKRKKEKRKRRRREHDDWLGDGGGEEGGGLAAALWRFADGGEGARPLSTLELVDRVMETVYASHLRCLNSDSV